MRLFPIRATIKAGMLEKGWGMRKSVLTAVALGLIALPAKADFTLHVLHINDFHSRIEPVNAFDSTCSAEDLAAGACFGGVARLTAKINALRDAIRAEAGQVIVLDAGDQFQGSLYYTTYKGAVEAEFLEAIGFDAMAVGNHEFDDGPAGLANLADRVSFPLVSGNTDISAEASLIGKVEDHVVLKVGGEKIGIVSALATDTVDTSSPGKAVTFADEIASLTKDVAALEAEGVTRIIALTHVGIALDMDIAARVPGIDAVVGGHSHTLLSNTDPARLGPYPLMVDGVRGVPVPVVQAYAYGKYLGHLVLTFDDQGVLVSATGDTILLDASVMPDPAVAARVVALAGPLEELKTRLVSEALAPIDGSRDTCRAMECAMGTLVAEAMLDRVAGQGVTIAIQNGGGLRASIDAGPITMGEVLTVLPFQNTLSTFEVSGAVVIAALENGVSEVDTQAGRFPQVAGLQFAFDPAKPAGTRVSEVKVRVGDIWAPIDPEGLYKVVSNNYLRGGGDGYDMFVEAANAYDFGPDLADVTAEYLAKIGPFHPFTDGRILRH